MKLLLVSTLALFSLPVAAQTASTTTSSTTTSTDTTTTPPDAPASAPRPSGSAMMEQVTSVLTQPEKDQLMSVRMKAMAANPDLQTEEMDLMQKGMSLQGGTATDADKLAFRDEVKQHADKVRAAMMKVDPTIEPVLAKIDAQVAKLRAQYQGQQ